MVPSKRSLTYTFLILSLGSILSVIGYWLLFTTFMIYDDEGYVLISLRNYIVHGGLYSKVYSQYGPFFYGFYDIIQHILHFEYNNTSGRWLTLINWMTASFASGFIIWHCIRSLTLMLCALSLTFLHLWTMISEPMHPGSLITALVSIGALNGVLSITDKNPVRFALGGGIIGTALLMTKINIGIFFLMAVGGWMLIHSPIRFGQRTAAYILIAVCTALTLSLMHSLLPAWWVITFTLVIITSAASLTLVLHTIHSPDHSLKTWCWLASSSTIILVAITTFVGSKGTDVIELINGIILNPIKHPGVYSTAIEWNVMSPALAILSFGFAIWLHNTRSRPGWVPIAIACTRFIFLVIYLKSGQFDGGKICLVYGLPMIWLLVIPTHGTPPKANDRARIWIGLVLIFQTLHAYPVAGSQIQWGSALFPTLLLMSIHETMDCLKPVSAHMQKWLSRSVYAAVSITLATYVIHAAEIGANRYYTGTPLKLNGAENIRMPDDRVDTLQIITKNLNLYSGTTFSFPGLYSVNIWTGQSTPTLANATHWFALLNQPQQQAIIQQLGSDPRACILAQDILINFMKKRSIETNSLLNNYLLKNFNPVMQLDGYSIWTHNGRRFYPTNIVQMQQIGPGPRLRMEGVVSTDLKSLSYIEIANYDAGSPPIIQSISVKIPAHNFTSTSILDEESQTASRRQLTKFTVEFTAEFVHHNPKESFVILRATDGRMLERLRFPF